MVKQTPPGKRAAIALMHASAPATTPNTPAKLLAALDRLTAYWRPAADLIDANALRTGIVELTRDRDDAREMLGECYVLSGADTDGNPPERMANDAVRAVGDLRRDYDEACEEMHGPNGYAKRAEAAEARVAELEQDAARYRWIRDNGGCPLHGWDTADNPAERDAAIDAAIDALAGKP